MYVITDGIAYRVRQSKMIKLWEQMQGDILLPPLPPGLNPSGVISIEDEIEQVDPGSPQGPQLEGSDLDDVSEDQLQAFYLDEANTYISDEDGLDIVS